MKRLALLTILLLTLLSTLAESPVAQANTAAPNMAALPLMFIEQQPNRYQVQLNGQSMWFTQDSMWLTTKQQNIKLTFQDTHPQARIEPLNPLETHISNFMGNDPAKWQTDIPVYSGVRYRNLYPNTDLIITSEQGKLAWRMENNNGGYNELGNERIKANRAHSLYSPFAVAVVLDNGTSAQTHTLDPNQSLTDQLAAIIDPQTPNSNTNPHMPRQQGAADLVWSTFLGGSGQDGGSGSDNFGKTNIAVDNLGNIYLVGSSVSTDFPTTTGAFDTTYGSSWDVVVVKLNSNGNLIYSTFIGGGWFDYGTAIAIDAQGNAYITGQTGSGDFPSTAGSFDPVNTGENVFVTKLNSAGNGLVYSTFLKGSDHSWGLDIAVDTTGSAYVTGRAYGTSFPSTVGAFSATHGAPGRFDGFVTKLKPDGSGLVYSTFLGGTSANSGESITVDSSGNAYVVGITQSSDWPTTSGAYDTTFNGGTWDTFIAKLNTTGSDRVFATLLGSSSDDYSSAIAVDGTGNVYISGITYSNGFPTTAGAFKTTFSDSSSIFITKLNSTGTGLAYSTFLGASGDLSTNIAIDPTGNTYIIVNICPGSGLFPTTANAFDTTHNGSYDTCVAKLNNTGSQLLYSTYFGGSDTEHGIGIAVDTVGNAYISGFTKSSNLPTTAGAYDTTYNGGPGDIFVAKLAITPPTLQVSPTPLTFNAVAGGTNPLAQNLTLSNTGGGTLTWTASDNATWLSLGSSSGTAPSTVNVNVDITGLAAATYNGVITVLSNGGNLTTTVTLNLSQPTPTPTHTPTLTPTNTPTLTPTPAPLVSLVPTTLDFGSQMVGLASSVRKVIMQNTGQGLLVINTITADGDFTSSHDCPANLAVNQSCTISITFTPSNSGNRTGTLYITSNATGSPHTVALSGTGFIPTVTPTTPPVPTTPAPITPAPTTPAPITPAPTTPAPITPAPTTPAPITPEPTTPAPTPTAPSADTATPTPTQTQTLTPTQTPTPTPTDPAPSEDTQNDTCQQAGIMPTSGVAQNYAFEQPNDEDWLKFQVTQGITYFIEIDVPPTSPADVKAELYQSCEALPQNSQGYAFSPNVRLQFMAPQNGLIYLRLTNEDAAMSGAQVSYQLSIRALVPQNQPGAVIIMAGKYKDNDGLQGHIHQAAQNLRKLFLDKGYSQIYYLATDLNQAGVSAEATTDNLRKAIVTWAQDKVDRNRALTIYLMDHGNEDKIYLNRPRGQEVTPTQLAGWLKELEGNVPGLRVNVIVEACHSGSFIDELGGPNRVIIASTGVKELAYASASSAIFSDFLLAGLRHDESLWSSFQRASWAAVAAHPSQVALIDDNGNGIPNEPTEGQEAARRGFTFVGSFMGDFGDKEEDAAWSPFISEAKIITSSQRAGTVKLQNKILDNKGVRLAWVEIYAPSYQPPQVGEEMVKNAPSATLPLTNIGNNLYEANYPNFNEVGTYRLVFRAEDNAQVEARPKVMTYTVSAPPTGKAVYLPLIVK